MTLYDHCRSLNIDIVAARWRIGSGTIARNKVGVRLARMDG